MRGIDVETTALDPADGVLSLIQVADPEHKHVQVWDMLTGRRPNLGGGWKLLFNGTGGQRRVHLPVEAVAHNAVFEERWLSAYGYDVTLEDTMIASQVSTRAPTRRAASSRTASHPAYPAS